MPLEQLRPAHYALCASLDDVVLNTPWGSSGTWAERSLVSTFHQEVRSGERFFDVLRQMCDNPGKFLPVIKLMYLCMSLGFHRPVPPVAAAASATSTGLREETYARHRPPAARRPTRILRRTTKGVDAPYRPARVSRAALGRRERAAWASSRGLFLWFSIGLNAASDDVYRASAGRPPHAHADHHAHADRRAAAGADAAAAARADGARPAARSSSSRRSTRVSSRCSARRPSRSCGSPVAACSPRAAPRSQPSFKPLLDRIGLALEGGAGLGAGDRLYRRSADPHHCLPVEFPALDGAREAASAIIAASIGDASRLSRGGQGGCRPDRAQLHAGGPRTQPAHRNRAAIGRAL